MVARPQMSRPGPGEGDPHPCTTAAPLLLCTRGAPLKHWSRRANESLAPQAVLLGRRLPCAPRMKPPKSRRLPVWCVTQHDQRWALPGGSGITPRRSANRGARMSITVWKWAKREPFGVGPLPRATPACMQAGGPARGNPAGRVCGRPRKNDMNLFRAQSRPSELLRTLTRSGARNSVRGSRSLI